MSPNARSLPKTLNRATIRAHLRRLAQVRRALSYRVAAQGM